MATRVPAAGATLAEFLAREAQNRGGVPGQLHAVLADVATTVGAIARLLARGAAREAAPALRGILADAIAEPLSRNGAATRLDLALPPDAPTLWAREEFLLAVEPLDGAPNVEVDLPVGSLFSILRRGIAGDLAGLAQPGARQLCAGYAVYGPATMLVLTLGDGAHGFTLLPDRGEFVLTHPALRTPATSRELAVDPANGRFWEPAVQHYVEDCLAGAAGPRARDFDVRWVESLVADTHRVLIRGGVVLHPRDSRADPTLSRLLLHANALAFVAEQAGAGASTGRGRILDVRPEPLDLRVAVALGTCEEIELIETYHRERNLRDFDAPLFGTRGLFRVSG